MRFLTPHGTLKPIRHARKYRVKWGEDSISMFQTDVKLFLYPFWKDHEVYEEFPLAGTKLTYDLYNASLKVAVEVQGQQHTKFVKFFHGTRLNFLEQLKRDKIKEDYAELNEIKLVTIFPDDEINKDLFLEFGVELV